MSALPSGSSDFASMLDALLQTSLNCAEEDLLRIIRLVGGVEALIDIISPLQHIHINVLNALIRSFKKDGDRGVARATSLIRKLNEDPDLCTHESMTKRFCKSLSEGQDKDSAEVVFFFNHVSQKHSGELGHHVADLSRLVSFTIEVVNEPKEIMVFLAEGRYSKISKSVFYNSERRIAVFADFFTMRPNTIFISWHDNHISWLEERVICPLMIKV